jgi:drug/metabolite transporter (DMT)-like permease
MNRTDLWNRIWKEDAIDPQRPPTLRKAGVYPLLGLLILVLGINWPILSMGLREVSPVWMTVLRLAGGTLVVWIFTAMSGRLRLPPREDMPVVLSVAFFRLAFVYLMVFTALQFVPPGRSSVLVWTASLWAVPMAWRYLGERMTRLRWTGLVIGILGIVFLVEPWTMSWLDAGVIFAHVLLLVSAVSNAGAAVHIRRHEWVSTPLQAMPWQLLVALVPMVILALLVEGQPRINWSWQLGLIVAYQGVLATGLALWAQVWVLRTLPAVSTNLSLMMVPVVGLIASVLIVGEVVSLPVLVGVVGILIGVSLNLAADRSTPLRGIEPLPD